MTTPAVSTGETTPVWAIKYTTIWKTPDHRYKVCDVVQGTILQKTGHEIGVYAEVIYKASREFRGYIYIPHIEDLVYQSPEVVEIEGQTETQQDLAQYVIWKNNVQYNLCGELCVCQIFKTPLKDMLEKWEAFPTSRFNRVFYGGRSRTTGVGDILNMAQALGAFEQISVQKALYESKSRRAIMSPMRIQSWLDQGWGFIIGVSIERKWGRLRSYGIRHWVVVTKVVPDGPDNALVEVYNPASNRPELYTWYEFSRSVRVPYGTLIKPKGEGEENDEE